MALRIEQNVSVMTVLHIKQVGKYAITGQALSKTLLSRLNVVLIILFEEYRQVQSLEGNFFFSESSDTVSGTISIIHESLDVTNISYGRKNMLLANSSFLNMVYN